MLSICVVWTLTGSEDKRNLLYIYMYQKNNVSLKHSYFHASILFLLSLRKFLLIFRSSPQILPPEKAFFNPAGKVNLSSYNSSTHFIIILTKSSLICMGLPQKVHMQTIFVLLAVRMVLRMW